MRCKTCSREAIEFITTDGNLLFVCFCPGKTVVEKREKVKIEVSLEEYKKKELKKLEEEEKKLEKELENKLKNLKGLVNDDKFGKVPSMQEDISGVRDRLEIVRERLDDFGK